ncbi:hypothetical protein J2W70_005152 [Pseudomonas koreensis]|jgi:hypothetical protein|uniref:DUF4435 domain-containing protein n=1 Tax=Pseudomonas koreensis TaxID=198620 RepID=UPI002865A072|nr:DUF4435 domain-containing protein [Pseudomonas koreensis]MDR7057751.1 hypothetical protein [Pseudomonas koreensis]
MSSEKPRPTVNEIFELLKRSYIPTVLVEGKNDIIFYRKVEEDLQDYGVDMLPAGNKGAVLELYEKIKNEPTPAPVVFVVDNDLWVHGHFDGDQRPDGVITTRGYSIENDMYEDGELEILLNRDERDHFTGSLSKFVNWYALAVYRKINGGASTFRTHPGKILDDNIYYDSEIVLAKGEQYPDAFKKSILEKYSSVLRGKSLFALLLRQLSAKRREVKFGAMQLMELGAARKGANYQRLSLEIRAALDKSFAQK